jgi:hypothetical protein
MDAEKLLKLADGLENYVKDKWWNYGRYYDRGFPTQECGSLACAIGWSVPIMNDPRLRFDKPSDRCYCYSIYLDGKNDIYNETIMAQYFDIPYEDAERIFNSPSSYGKSYDEVTRLDVAKMIREYVEENRESNPCYSDD